MFMPNFSYSFQADIAVIVLYKGTMFMQALLSSLRRNCVYAGLAYIFLYSA